jgi:type IV pilus assembly protein PilA
MDWFIPEHYLESFMHARDYRRKGFTLLELMIVVAIIGFLASIAIPQYQNYSMRARLTEGVQMLGAARVGVTEFFLLRGSMPKDAEEAGLVALETPVIKSLGYSRQSNNSATLSVEVQNTGRSDLDGKFFSMVAREASGALAWVCRPGNQGGANTLAVPGHFLPASCRG